MAVKPKRSADRQKRTRRKTQFAREYVKNGHQAKKAALAAGYADSGAAKIAREMLKESVVQDLIADATLTAAARADVKVLEVLQAACEIAFLDPAECFQRLESGKGNTVRFALKNIADIPLHVRRGISSFKMTKAPGPGGGFIDVIEVKFWSKPDALDLLAKHLGMLTIKVEHAINERQMAKLTDEELVAKQSDAIERYRLHMQEKRKRLTDGVADAVNA